MIIRNKPTGFPKTNMKLLLPLARLDSQTERLDINYDRRYQQEVHYASS